MKTTITTRQLTHHDVDFACTAVELLNRTQGRGLFDMSYLEERFHKPDSCIVAAFGKNELLGIGIVEILKKLDYFLPFVPSLAQELENKVVASFTTLSVQESFQGMGVGQLLSRKRLEWVAERNCDVVLGVSWLSGLAHTSNRTFEKAGFRSVKKLDDFYHKSSIEKPFDCPGCHRIPCLCKAVLYRLDLTA